MTTSAPHADTIREVRAQLARAEAAEQARLALATTRDPALRAQVAADWDLHPSDLDAALVAVGKEAGPLRRRLSELRHAQHHAMLAPDHAALMEHVHAVQDQLAPLGQRVAEHHHRVVALQAAAGVVAGHRARLQAADAPRAARLGPIWVKATQQALMASGLSDLPADPTEHAPSAWFEALAAALEDATTTAQAEYTADAHTANALQAQLDDVLG